MVCGNISFLLHIYMTTLACLISTLMEGSPCHLLLAASIFCQHLVWNDCLEVLFLFYFCLVTPQVKLFLTNKRRSWHYLTRALMNVIIPVRVLTPQVHTFLVVSNSCSCKNDIFYLLFCLLQTYQQPSPHPCPYTRTTSLSHWWRQPPRCRWQAPLPPSHTEWSHQDIC